MGFVNDSELYEKVMHDAGTQTFVREVAKWLFCGEQDDPPAHEIGLLLKQYLALMEYKP